MVSAPQDCLAGRLDDERPQRDAIATYPVGQRPENNANAYEPDAEGGHDEARVTQL